MLQCRRWSFPWRGAVLALAFAVPADALGPRVTASEPDARSNSNAVTALQLTLSAAVVGAEARSPDSYVMLDLGSDRLVGGGDDSVVNVTPQYVDAQTQVTLAFDAALAEGLYQLTVHAWDGAMGLRGTDGTALDQAQNGDADAYVATLAVDLTGPTVTAVAAGTAVLFDGDHDAVKLPAAAANGLADFTVEMWFQTTYNSPVALLSGAHAGDANTWLFWLSWNGSLEISHSGAAHTWSLGSGIYDGRWHHLAAAYDNAANLAEVFLDGVSRGEATLGGDVLTIDADGLWVAQEQDAVGGGFDPGQAYSGRLAELRLWNTRRSAADIGNLLFERVVGNEADLVACWPLNDAGAADIGPQHYDGILTDLTGGALPSHVPCAAPIRRSTLRITFDDAGGMDPVTVEDVGNYHLAGSGGDGIFGNGNDTDVSAALAQVAYDATSAVATLRVQTPLAEDVYRLTVSGTTTVRDLAGNPLLDGADYVSGNIGFGIGFPAVAIDLQADSDTGADHADELTRSVRPAVDVTVDQAGTLALDMDGDGVPEISRDIAGAGVTTIVPDADLADGVRHMTAVFTSWLDAVGSATLDVTVDTAGPTVTAVAAGPEAANLRVTFSDAGALDAVSVTNTANYLIVRSGQDGEFDDGDDVDVTGSLTTVTYDAGSKRATLVFDADLTEDYYRVTVSGTATVLDLAGNPLLDGADYVSDAVAVVVGAPTVTVDLQADSDTGAATTDNITRSTRPALDVTVSKRGVVGVDFDGDGAYEESVQADSSGVVVVRPSADLDDGTRDVTARLTPWIGAVATSDALSLTIDTVGPRGVTVLQAAALPYVQRRLAFSETIDAATLTTDRTALTGPAGDLGPVAAIAADGDQFILDFATLTAAGNYRLDIGPAVTDLAGNAMDQDGDGINGEAGDDVFADSFAFAEALPTALQVVRVRPVGPSGAPADVLQVFFSQPVNETTFTVDDVAYDVGARAPQPPTSVTRLGEQWYEIDFGGGSGAGVYLLTIGPDIAAAGNGARMDQDGDGTAGEPGDDAWRADVFTAAAAIGDQETGYDNHHLIVAGATLTVDGAHTFADLTIDLDGTVTHSPATETTAPSLDLTVDGTLWVGDAGSIDATGKGYLPLRTAGNTPTTGQESCGGSHGGRGHTGSSNGAVPEVYDNFTDPVEPGGGGSQVAGGGLIRIRAGTAAVEGAIRADGVNAASAYGGGAGGGVWLSVETLTGGGRISANGGDGDAGWYGSYGGSGGGGRIAVYYRDAAGFDLAGRITAHSGDANPYYPGSVGSVYLHPETGPDRLLITSHGTAATNWQWGEPAVTPLLAAAGGGADVTVDTLEIRDDKVVVETPAGTAVHANDLMLVNGAILTHTACSETATRRLELILTGTLSIDAQSAIDATGKGYLPLRTAGNTPTTGQEFCGGSHGGRGHTGSHSGAVPEVYDDFTDPVEPGGGGSQVAGGGLIRIRAGTAAVEGAIRADGVNAASAYGGGAGGSVWLSVETLTGGGRISANGGDGDAGWYGSYGGSGGGGRIAVYYRDAAGFDLAGRITAHGGGDDPYYPGSVGSIYLHPETGPDRLLITSHGTAATNWQWGEPAVTPLLPVPGAGGELVVDSLEISDDKVVVISANDAVIRVGDLSLIDGAILTHPACTDTTVHALNLFLTGTLTIDPQSAIDVSARGYRPNRTMGNSASGGAAAQAGGSYGGLGYGGQPNNVYGYALNPREPGAGGNDYYLGGSAGGGLVRIRAAAAVIDGFIRADGEDGHLPAGSGGGILLDVGTWSGNGRLEATGGNGDWGSYGASGGSGGGGRIAVYVSGGGRVTPVMDVAGGSGGWGPGADGTARLQASPVFWWNGADEELFNDSGTLSWELLGAPAGTTVTLTAVDADGGETVIATDGRRTDTFTWDTSAVTAGRYTVRADYADTARTPLGTADRTVVVAHDVRMHTGQIADSATWAADTVHILSGTVAINAGAVVTLAAGAVVKALEGARIVVAANGSLVSAGTADAPVRLTAIADDATAGDTNADGRLSVPLVGSWEGVTAEDGGSMPALGDGFSIRYAVVRHAGDLTADETWGADLLHWVTNDVGIPDGMTLTVAAGAVVRFAVGRSINGGSAATLTAVGTRARPILFTSFADTSVDTGDPLTRFFESAAPQPGDWGQISVPGTSRFEYVTARYGGGNRLGYNGTAMIRMNGSGVYILRACTLAEAEFDGLHQEWGGEGTVENCLFINCDVGAHTEHLTTGRNNTFYANRVGIISGWSSSDPADRQTWVNNLVLDSTETGFSSGGGSPRLRYNNVWNSGTTDYDWQPAFPNDDHNISADPRLQDAAGGDFRPDFLSPCIDAADGTAAPTTDKNGNARYDDPRTADTGAAMPGSETVPDIGAYEFVESAAADVDLVVDQVTGPATVTARDVVTVSWQVSNRGPATVSGSWQDRLALQAEFASAAATLIPLADVAVTATLAPGQAVTLEHRVTVPGGTPGTWYWQVTANRRAEIFEGANQANNTTRSTSPVTLALPPLTTDGNVVAGSFDGTNDPHWFTVAQAAGESLLIRLDADADTAVVRLFAATDFLPTRQIFDLRSPQFGDTALLGVPAPAGDRTIYVLALAEALPGEVRGYGISAQPVVFELSQTDLAAAGNAGSATLKLGGFGFADGMTVTLADTARAVRTADVTVLDSTEAFARFDLTDVPAGVYDLVADLGGLTSTLGHAFTVDPGKGPAFHCRLLAPPRVRANRPFEIVVEYGNDGDADCEPRTLMISNTGDYPTGYGATPRDALGNGDTRISDLVLLAVPEHGATPGYLRPGEQVAVTIYSVSDNVYAYYSVEWESAASDDAIDWAAVEADICPCQSPRWDEVWPALKTAIGDTDGAYVAFVAQAVAEARRYDIELIDNQDIFQYIVDRQYYRLDTAQVKGTAAFRDTGAAIGDAELAVTNIDSDDVFSVRTWHDGTFVFWQLPPGTYRATIDGAYEGSPVQFELPENGTLTDLPLQFDAGTRLTGTVTAAVDGHAIAGAVITVDDPYLDNTYSATSDEHGAYSLTGLRPGRLLVGVAADGFVTERPTEHDLSAGGVVSLGFQLGVGASLSGTVDDGGRTAVGGASVLVSSTDAGFAQRVETDNTGAFAVAGVPAGTYDVEAYAHGAGAGAATDIAVAAGAAVTVHVTLAAGATLAVAVTAADTGTAVAEAAVAVGALHSDDPVLTDAAGEATLTDLPGGDLDLLISADGYLPQRRTVTLIAGATTPQAVALRRLGRLHGTVTGGGQPLADVVVEARSSLGIERTVRTAADGTYALTGLEDADYVVAAAAGAGNVRIGNVNVTLDESGNDRQLDLIAATAELSGTVQDADGQALADVTVALISADGVPEQTTATQVDGSYRFVVLSAGAYQVRGVAKVLGFALSAPVIVALGDAVTVPPLTPADSSLLLTVTDGGRAVVEGAGITIRPADLGLDMTLLAFSDHLGLARIGHLSPGDYDVSVTAPGLAPVQRTISVGVGEATETLALPAGRVVQGLVQDLDGDPVAAAVVTLVDAATGVLAVTFTDPSGAYRRDNLGAGPYTLWVTDGVLRPERVDGVTPAAGTATDVNVVLQNTGHTLDGDVKDGAGVPLAGAIVDVLSAQGVVLQQRMTDDYGNYRLGPLADGTYTLVFDMVGMPEQRQSLNVTADQTLATVTFGGGRRGWGRERPERWWGWFDPTAGLPPPDRAGWDSGVWRNGFKSVWAAYGQTGHSCPDALAAYQHCLGTKHQVDETFANWQLSYKAVQQLSSATLAYLALNIPMLTGKISLFIASISGVAPDPGRAANLINNATVDSPQNMVDAGKTVLDLYEQLDPVIAQITGSLSNFTSSLLAWDFKKSDFLMNEAMTAAGSLATIADAILAWQNRYPGAKGFGAAGAIGKIVSAALLMRDIYNYWREIQDRFNKDIGGALRLYNSSGKFYFQALKKHQAAMNALIAATACRKKPQAPPPPPPRKPGGGGGGGTGVGQVQSRDPNEKISLGVGAAGWVAEDQYISYVIRFENKTAASAPAQTVRVIDPLPADLDLSSFELQSIGFNDATLHVPAGLRNYMADTAVGTDPNPVRVTANLDVATRTLNCVIQSYDVVTGELPADPLAGFLPPNDPAPQGEGYVSFRVKANPGLATGDEIRNVAEIIFDDNASIFTNQVSDDDPTRDPDKEALVTIDAEAPAGSGVEVNKTGDGSSVALNLTIDAGAGAGLGWFEIYVAAGDAAATLWQTVESLTTTFAGAFGNSYSFIVRAWDAVGHGEALRTTADATVRLPDWALPVTVTAGAHVATVYLGVAAQATGGFDAGLDENAPNTGRAGGRVYAEGTPGEHAELAYDVRPTAETVVWTLNAQPDGAPLELTWSAADIADGRHMWLTQLDENGSVDAATLLQMNQEESLTVTAAARYQVAWSVHRARAVSVGPHWRLLTLPLEPVETDPVAFFGNRAKGNAVFGYVAATDGRRRLRRVAALAGGEAYWVFADSADWLLEIGDALAAPGRVTLRPGWNLVAVGQDGRLPANADLPGPVWAWLSGNEAGRYEVTTVLRAGRAYWLYWAGRETVTLDLQAP